VVTQLNNKRILIMGRPLNKKYFGNRNIGTSGTGDNGIGGEGIASISNGTVGAIQINNTYPTFPYLTAADPTLPGGVTADLSVTWEIAAIVISNDGSGYTINQTAAAVTDVNGLYDQADTVPVLTINTDGSGNVSAVNITSRGEFTNINGTGITTWAVEGAGGTNAQLTVTFRLKSVTVNEKGSGYVSAPALSWSAVNGGTMPSAQSVTLTTDTGNVWSSTNQENAIQITAYIPAADGGSSAVLGDITKQVSGSRYKVKTAQGTGIVKLVADTPAAGEATIVATDANGNTYYVTKLTAHRALLTRLVDDGSDDDWLYATGTAAPWSFAAADGLTVQIANA
jgi:hypothetical protein